MIDDNNKKADIAKAMTNIEFYPASEPLDLITRNSTKIPLAELAIAGTVAASFLEPFRTVTQAMTTGNAGLYRAILPQGATLAAAHDGSGFLGSAVEQGKGLVGQARFQPADDLIQTVTTTVPINPMTLTIAIALAEVNQKLDAIQKTQQEMLEYIKQKDKARLKGDLNTLADILNNYKFNWGNETYKTNKHMLAQDIKRSSEESIIFNQTQINSALKMKEPIHLSKDVRGVAKNVQELLKDYQLSLYLYSFSSFLEVLLLENFDHGYLSGVAKKNDEYSIQYREFYTRCYNQLENFADSSVQAYLLGSISILGKGAGSLIAKTPIGEKTQIDEALIGAGKDVGNMRKNGTRKTMSAIIEAKDETVQPFIDNIKTMDQVYNEPSELIIGKDGIYVHRLSD